ncbi:MAG: porin family protein [Firmicutes bacterium]|nr:porin family protein [Bacillota bacterium]MCM1400673.1 porin family protein [Bacteroides sp.]MCM1476367.1 porin family protein [Bacteroides sp.]
MKKILIALVALLGITSAATAQKANFTFGYGGYTLMDACDYHDDLGKVKTAWGALNVGVNFKVAPNFWIGPSYTFSSSEFKHSDTNLYYHVIMLNGRYDYYKNSIVRLYAHVGLGVDITHISPEHFDATNKAYFAYHIAPLGADVPITRNFNIFGEIGFGAQGLLQVGGRINF